MNEPIPCTVAMLTFNSSATLPKALQSIEGFAELVVADGGSTDGTREIVERFGGRVVDQPRASQDSSGRLVNYGVARDHLRRFATQLWLLQLDSDEYLTAELVDDLRGVCVSDESGPNNFTIQARYEVDEEIVDCATNYPMSHLRLYRVSACAGYRGVTDEEPCVTGPQGELTSWFVIPYPKLRLLLRKYLRYLRLDQLDCAALDAAGLKQMSAFRKSSIRWFLRDFRRKRSGGCRNALPLHLELIRLGFYCGRYVVTVIEIGRRSLVPKDPRPS